MATFRHHPGVLIERFPLLPCCKRGLTRPCGGRKGSTVRKYFRGGMAAVAGVLVATSVVLTPTANAAAAQEPDTRALAGALATQEITWEECTFPGVAEETV